MHTPQDSPLRFVPAPPHGSYFVIILGDAVTGAICPSMGKYHDCILDGRRTISRKEMDCGVRTPKGGPNSPRCPIDLDPWAFYPLPVLGQEGFILGAPKSDAVINTARFMAPHTHTHGPISV